MWTWLSFPFRCGQYLIRLSPTHPQYWSGFLGLSPIIMAGLIVAWDDFPCWFQKWEGLKPFFLWSSFTFFLQEFLLLPSIFVVWCLDFIYLWRSVKLCSMHVVNWFYFQSLVHPFIFFSATLKIHPQALYGSCNIWGSYWFLFPSNYVSASLTWTYPPTASSSSS